MNNEIEKRLHRVKIKLDKTNILCPYSKVCLSAENGNRCNDFYLKCTKFSDFISDSQ